MNRIKKNDEVIVISGKDKGKKAQVIRVLEDRVVIRGVNIVKKHEKPNPKSGVQGGIIEKEMPIHVSNVMLYDTSSGKRSKVGFKTLEDGRKVRYFKLSKEVIDL